MKTRFNLWHFALALILAVNGLCAQVSPDCGTAIPICNNTPVNGGTTGYGVNDFGNAAHSGCLEPTLTGYIESNAAWYRFRTEAAGQMGFNIGFDPSEDWDFALYRASDCNNLGEPVRCNFYDNREQSAYMGVGEHPAGQGDSYQYEPWLEVQAGEDYYLLINNFSNTNSGFSIQFSGNLFIEHPDDALDCSIIDNLLGPPIAACAGESVLLDGSAACTCPASYQWYADAGSGFQPISGATTETLTVTTAAMYRVQVSLSDGSQVISDVQVGFSPAASTQPVADQATCSGMGYPLTDHDTGALGTLSPADFRITYHQSVLDAQTGANPLPATWEPSPGSHTVYIRTTSVANPDCYDASETFNLQVLAAPQLDFPSEVFLCEGGAGISIGPAQAQPGVVYAWDTGDTTAQLLATQPGTYTLTATVSGGGQTCPEQRTVTVVASNPPAIAEILIRDMQALNRVEVVPAVEGSFEYSLDYGNYQASPVFEGVTAGSHQLYMRDTFGCGTLTETITVVGFAAFFTPNGDGLNDRWQIIGLGELSEPMIHIFDRYGKLLKQMDDTSGGWDGVFNGRVLPASDYWFRLTYLDPNGQRIEARYLSTHFALKR